MKYSVLHKHIQKSRLLKERITISYKIKNNHLWCNAYELWPNYHSIPLKIEHIIETQNISKIKLSYGQTNIFIKDLKNIY